MFSFPYLSYEIMREKFLFGNLNFLKIIKQAAIVLGVLGPLYAAFSSYFLYIPKEVYWENLSQKKKNFDIEKIFQNSSEIDQMKPKKPFKRIRLVADSKEK